MIAPILVLAAVLRLWRLGTSVFDIDQAGIFIMARDAVAHGMLPATGIVSSIQTFCPPATIYLYLPFALAGNPLVGVYATALANLAAVGLAYFFMRRVWGYWPALLGALYFAVAYWPVYFSRFIWQQNLLPPLVMLLMLGAAQGMANRRAGWLMWAIPLWGVMIQLHPSALPLAIVFPLAWLLGPQSVRRRDLAIGIALFVALFIPTVMWEYASHGYDLPYYLAYFHHPSRLDAQAFVQFIAISGLPPDLLGNGIAWKLLLEFSRALPCVALVYVAARVLVGLRQALGVGMRVSRGPDVSAKHAPRVAGILAALDWLRAPERLRWRVEALLVVWPASLVLAFTSHHSPVYLSYYIPSFPAQFLALGVLLYDGWRWLTGLGARNRQASEQHNSSIGMLPQLSGQVILATGLVGALLFVILWGNLGATPAAYATYPGQLQAEEAGLTQAEALVRAQHVGRVTLNATFNTLQPMQYLLLNGYGLSAPTQITSSGNCLVGPLAQAPTLYLMTGGVGPAEMYLEHLPGVSNLFANTPGGAYYRAYLVSSTAFQSALAPLSFPHATALRQAGATSLRANFGGMLALTSAWQARGIGGASDLALAADLLADPPGVAFSAQLALNISLLGANGQALEQAQARCVMAPWQSGQRLYFFYARVSADKLAQASTLQMAAQRIQSDIPASVTFGPLALESAYDLGTISYYEPQQTMPLQPGACRQPLTCAGDDAQWG